MPAEVEEDDLLLPFPLGLLGFAHHLGDGSRPSLRANFTPASKTACCSTATASIRPRSSAWLTMGAKAASKKSVPRLRAGDAHPAPAPGRSHMT